MWAACGGQRKTPDTLFYHSLALFPWQQDLSLSSKVTLSTRLSGQQALPASIALYHSARLKAYIAMPGHLNVTSEDLNSYHHVRVWELGSRRQWEMGSHKPGKQTPETSITVHIYCIAQQQAFLTNHPTSTMGRGQAVSTWGDCKTMYCTVTLPIVTSTMVETCHGTNWSTHKGNIMM